MGYADARRLEPEHSEHRTSLVSPPPRPTFCLHLPRGNGPPGCSSPYRRAENDQREPPPRHCDLGLWGKQCSLGVPWHPLNEGLVLSLGGDGCLNAAT